MTRAGRAGVATVLALLAALTAGCGFHLRGSTGVTMPAELREMRVVVQGSRAAYDPLRLAVESALRDQAGVTVGEAAGMTTLLLTAERFESQVLSVGTSGRVAEYLLRYDVSFRVLGGDGHELVAEQIVQLQRDYSYDQSVVLAREREERELREAMQRDAAQQILRRLSKATIKPAPPAAGNPQ